jgi:hypothetical protein
MTKKVDVFVVGAQKSATSAIVKNLSLLDGVLGEYQGATFFLCELCPRL